MLSAEFKKFAHVWPTISNVFTVPRTEQEYDRAVAFLDELIDEVGEDENHPLASLMDTIGTLIETYESEHFPDKMAKLEQYRAYVQQLIKQYGAYKPSYGDIEVETVFDTERDHYELINVGWHEHRRIRSAVLHIDIKNGKI